MTKTSQISGGMDDIWALLWGEVAQCPLSDTILLVCTCFLFTSCLITRMWTWEWSMLLLFVTRIKYLLETFYNVIYLSLLNNV